MQTILAELKDNPYELVIASSMNPDNNLIEFAQAIQSNPISGTCDIIAICCSSSQCCKDIQNTIAADNSSATWPSVPIQQVQLFCDCET